MKQERFIRSCFFDAVIFRADGTECQGNLVKIITNWHKNVQ